VTSGFGKKMMVGEIHTDQANALGTHESCQAEGYIRRVPGVGQGLGVGQICSASLPQSKAYDVGVVDTEVQMGEECPGTG